MTYFGRVQCWGPLSLAIPLLRKGKKKKKVVDTGGSENCQFEFFYFAGV